jgi:hypothetical protein
VNTKTSFALIAATFVAATSTQAATTLIQHTFDGDATSLNAEIVDTVNPILVGASTTWASDPIFKRNGTATSAGPDINEDRGAYIDMGAGFVFSTNTQYTLTLSYTGLSNAVLFAGFMSNAPTVGERAQTQHANFALRARFITANEDTTAYRHNTPGHPGTLNQNSGNDTTAADTLTLTLDTGATLATSTFSVDGSANVAVDVTGQRYLYLGFEDNGTSTGTFTSLNFSVVPEPSSAALLGSLGVLALFRRRR